MPPANTELSYDVDSQYMKNEVDNQAAGVPLSEQDYTFMLLEERYL